MGSEKLTSLQKTTIACVAIICLMMTVIISANVMHRPAKSEAEAFIEACAWGNERSRPICAQMFAAGPRCTTGCDG